ncbi:caspase family protein [Streptomyces bohaiensis]|uniref:vWA-MoxR associated protein C-terminal domain-containing protein n=1 Tax=Streptomyces bohaiensis TaxID=1431344 RepID=A0ABX1CAZ1_9ACTN|nr:caspase family protein [Streptomyces bohaiensis]NJQ13474.1 hypothetical protein [Streptomyces bohaiensis]
MAPTELPFAVRPERTFAFVAGVEKYEISDSWNLRGPARDALRFTGWLTGTAQVPHENIRLLLSPLEPDALDWSATPGLAALKDTYRPATEENVKAALMKDLADREGDLLWIFWAGHGYLLERDMLLPYEDASAGLTQHLNLDSMLHWWRTDTVRRPHFPLQAAVVDACRTDAPRGSRLNFGRTDYGGGLTQPWRHQFRLYAAREGEAAKNDTERAAGQFTEALLAELTDRPLPEGTRNLAEIGRTVHRRFKELHERGEGWQLPEFVVDRGWDGCSFLDVPGDPDGSVLKAGRLDQVAWDGLGETFGCRPLPRCTYDAYAWAFKAAGCTTPVHPGLPADTLMDVARDLDERQGRQEDVPLVLPFVRFLAQRCEHADQAWSRQLREWEKLTRERLGVPALPPPPPPPRSTVLHVRLDPAADSDRHFVRMWLRRGTTEVIWESAGQPLTLDQVKDELFQQLNCISLRLEANAADGEDSVVERVEFDVPIDQLNEAFEQWRVPRGTKGKLSPPLGVLHEVVVRCPDERHDVRAFWLRKWNRLHAHGGQRPSAVRVVHEAEVVDALAVDLSADADPACVVAHTTGTGTQNVLDALHDWGVPVAVWLRDGPVRDSAQQLAALLSPNRAVTADLDVLALPRTIRDLRRGALAGQSADGADQLVLLWDDPDYTTDHWSLA